MFLLPFAARPVLAQLPTEPPADTTEETNPAVLAVLESNPQTPDQLLRAVVTLASLDRPNLAKPLLARLVKADLDEEALADLVEANGSNMFLRLARAQDLAPEAQSFSDAAMAAIDKRTRDPERLAALVAELQDPGQRRHAIVDLLAAKTSAVTHLIGVLADRNRRSEHEAVRGALVAMGSMAVDPLVGTLASEDDALKIEALRALAALESERAAVFLIGPAVSAEIPQVRAAARLALLEILGETPTRGDAKRALERRVRRYLAGTPPLTPDHQGLVQLWQWDSAAQESVQRAYPAGDVGMVLAARLAEDLYTIEPENAEYRRLHMGTLLEAAKIRLGYDKPLPRGAGSAWDRCAASGPAALEDLLQYSLERGFLGAAAASAEMLGEIGSTRLLIGDAGKPAPLVAAVRHGDRRVRFAALRAIMKFDPRRPYAGSSAVPDALGFFAGSAASRHALVARPRAAQGQSLAALLGQLGYDADVATTGQRLLEMAANSPALDLVLVDTAIARPEMREVLYRLRRDVRTRRVPIGLIGAAEELDGMRRIAAEFPLTEVFPRPQDLESVEFQVARLNEQAGRNVITDEERTAQAAAALGWIATLAAERRAVYDLQHQVPVAQQAVLMPGLTGAASDALAALGTADAQSALADAASQLFLPIEDRQAAADAFGRSVSQHGILLTSKEILRQYDRYNASETADKQTQRVLSSILDVIEAQSQQKP